MKYTIYHFFLTTMLAGLTGCHERNTTPFRDAAWIGEKEAPPLPDSLMYGDHPAPQFRKEFSIEKQVAGATLFITAAGYYEARLNGEKVGKNYLDPAWTRYDKRIYYAAYDVTSQLREGNNCLATILGNGFYNPLPLRMWGRRNLRESLPVGQPVFISSLRIEYRDGSEDVLATDGSWKYFRGPILKNNVYLGEVYDGGRETEGWDRPGYDDNGWTAAAIRKDPGGELQKAFFPAVQASGRLKPIAVFSPSDGIYIADMGVNFTGLYRIRLRGRAGDTIVFRFGERIYENGELNPMTAVCGQIKREGMGGPGAPPIAWQTDSYIFGDREEVWYRPTFTFHTYRYMEIAGLSYPPDISDLEGMVLHTNVNADNRFTCSSGLINEIQQATRRTFLSNLISVQSDCPAREKFGYGGDLIATAESFIYNFDMQAFYRKTVYDWLDAMQDSVFIDTAPFVGIRYCGLSWESAFLLTQYDLYLYYNDIELVRELYETDLKWMEKVARLHPEAVVEEGLSDHESLEPVPVELTGTAHYLQCARVMKRFAGLMGDREKEDHFELLALKLRQNLLEMFWEQPVAGPINRQTLFATLLYHDVIPAAERAAALDSLLTALAAGPSGHFTTGIFGTKYILEALSLHQKQDRVFDVVNSKAYPGWGHMIDRGATTLWETWKESDNTYSNCHPMFGSVTEWLYRWLGGIRPDPEYPGFERYIVAPFLPGGLDSVNCSYHSPLGEIVSNWKKEGPDKQVHRLVVPGGSTAWVSLPAREDQTAILTEKSGRKSPVPEREGTNRIGFELGPGDYTIRVSKK